MALPRVAEVGISAADLDARLMDADQPFVVRGLAIDWPLVRAGLDSADAARSYLVAQSRDRSFAANIGTSPGDDRLFYDAAMRMNFRMVQGSLAEFMAAMAAADLDAARSTLRWFRLLKNS